MLGFDLILLFEYIMISVFDGLNSIPHFNTQLLSVLKLLFKVCSKSIWFLKFLRSDTSSAKSEIFDCMSFSISFKKLGITKKLILIPAEATQMNSSNQTPDQTEQLSESSSCLIAL